MSGFTNNRIYDKLFVQKRMPDKCLLCGFGELSELGHIIPKLVMRWLKHASKKQEFFLNNDPLRKVQDTPAFKFMCKPCEKKIGLTEKYFTDNHYKRYYRGQKVKQLTDEVYYFAVSVAWRLIVLTERLKSTPLGALDQSYGGIRERARTYLLDRSIKPELDVYVLCTEEITKNISAERINADILSYSVCHGLKAHHIYHETSGFLMTPVRIPTVSFKIGAYYFFVVMSGYFANAKFQVDSVGCGGSERLFEVRFNEEFLGFVKWMMGDNFHEIQVSMESSDYYLRRSYI